LAAPLQAGIGAHTCKTSTDDDTVTTTGISSVGASAAIIVVGSAKAQTAVTPTTTGSDTVTGLTEQDDVSNTLRGRIWYVVNPTSSATYQVTATRTTGYPSVCVLMLTGTATSPFDVQNGNNTNMGGTTLQIGSVTPSMPNSIVIDGFVTTDTGAPSINSSQTLIDNAVGTAHGFGVAIAYEIQTAITARNPTWTMGAAVVAVGMDAVFKPAFNVVPVITSGMLRRSNQ